MGELDKTMSAREFMEWESFYQLEPFGEDRADLRNAILCSTIFNLLKGKKAQPKEPRDYMPFLNKKKGVQAQILDVMNMFS